MDPLTIDPIHITIRLLAAILLGGLIGMERESKNSRSAGFRTHILVCLGAALIMLLSEYGFSEFAKLDNVQLDPARLAAQVISGIGFLGAGTIIYTGKTISGLTTAASLWVVAAIGLSIGAGFYYAAVLTCILAVLSLWFLSRVERKLFHGKKSYTIKIKTSDRPSMLHMLSGVMTGQGADIYKFGIEQQAADDSAVWLTFYVLLSNKHNAIPLMDEIKQVDGVYAATFE